MLALTLALVAALMYLRAHREARLALLHPLELRPDEFDAPLLEAPQSNNGLNNRNMKFPFKKDDRVAWIGSSSTYLGTWPATMEFLLRSRHPELNLTFSRHSTGDGTFATGLLRLPDWLERSHPTLVFLNYGGNDGNLGKRYLDEFHKSLEACVRKTREFGATPILMTHQPGDPRYTGDMFNNRRAHYAADMLQFCAERKFPLVDIFHPLQKMFDQARLENPDYTINSDMIHLTDSAYVAWGFLLYDALNPLEIESRLELDWKKGMVLAAKNCSAEITAHDADVLTFQRVDAVLPILPPSPVPSSRPNRGYLSGLSRTFFSDEPKFALEYGQDLPSRSAVPLEAHSRYILKVNGLPLGQYELMCNDLSCGKASAEVFAAGVNLNSMLLDQNLPAPWNGLAQQLWEGARLEQLKGRALRFQLRRAR